MDVFVGNLPGTITLADMERLMRPFDGKVQVKLEQKQYKEGGVVCFGVCAFSSERLARKAIKKLDGTLLFGRTLSVREYLYRSYSNERRALGWRTRPWDGEERRGGERRNGTALADPDDMFASTTVVESDDEQHIVIEGFRNLATKQT